MKTITTEETIKAIVNTYVAEDGTEFKIEKDCKTYEALLVHLKTLEEIKPLMIYEDDFTPCNGGENYENHLYRWFKVENQEQLDKVNDAYNTLIKVISFPECICVEQHDETDFDCYGTTLTECKEYVAKFFGDGFGITISFDK